MSFKLLWRDLSTGRKLGAAVRSSRVEMDFKESNPISCPSEVMDHNIPGISSRLRLYELSRLQEQFQLDKPELENLGLQNKNILNLSKSSDAAAVEVTTHLISAFPGTATPTPGTDSSAVTVSVRLTCIGLSDSELERLRKLANVPSDETILSYSISAFPFQSQNRRRAAEILHGLIDACKRNVSLADFSEEEKVPWHDMVVSVRNRAPIRKSKRRLEFPAEWDNFQQPQNKLNEE